MGGGGSYEFGVDPNDDPELALALRYLTLLTCFMDSLSRQLREWFISSK
jgi:hypothetical protein